MVQKSGFQVTLRKPSGETFPEVTDPRTGDVYVVSSPGEHYVVHCEVLHERRHWRPDGKTALYRFATSVDGKDVGVRKRTRNDAIVRGFLRSGDRDTSTYGRFKFAEAASDTSTVAHSLDFQEGRIQVTVKEVAKTGEMKSLIPENLSTHASAATATVASLCDHEAAAGPRNAAAQPQPPCRFSSTRMSEFLSFLHLCLYVTFST